MAALTEKDLIQVLETILPADDDTIAIYSGIWTFAPQFRWPADEVGPRLLNIIDEFAGPDRTLIFPTYSYLDFARNRIYDLSLSKPETGVLPETALADKRFRRSHSPMNSYAVRGPRADELLALPCTTAWGTDGVLGWMCDANIRVSILGVSWLSCSLMHYAEETLQVPYRYYKRFKGELLDNGEPLGSCEEVMYSRSLHAVPEWDITALGPALSDAGVVLKSPNRRIPMESAKARDFHRVNEGMFAKNPYIYHENADELKAWVKIGKEAEIATLSTEEKWPIG